MSLATHPPAPDSLAGYVSLARHCRELAERDERIARLTQKVNELQADLERRRKYDRIPNQALSTKAQKLAYVLDQQSKAWRAAGRHGAQQVAITDLAEELGLGEKATRAGLDDLERVGHLRIEQGDAIDVPRRDKEGRVMRDKRGNTLTIQIRPIKVEVLGKDPDELALQETRNHGGRRCQHCGEDAGTTTKIYEKTDMVRRTTRRTAKFCKGCGDLVAQTTETVDEIIKHGEYKPKFSSSQIDSDSNNTTSEEPCTPTARQLDPFKPQPPLEVVAEVETPAELLLALAGDDPTHIRMQPTGPDKYLTVKTPVTTALIERHIRGEVMLGTTLRHTGGKTRMLRWEEDDPDGFETLRQAAVLLANTGALPVLEDSPSIEHPGGGHLYLIFDGLVDAAAARATAEHHAPTLRTVKEHWPSAARVRLPAGRYRRLSVDAWCEVWAPAGIKRSQDAAFDFLLSRQTPANWITESPPAVEAIPRRRSVSTYRNPRWIPPTRTIPYGSHDTELTRYAMAMAGKGMTEWEIVDELRRIVDELCNEDPSNPFRDSDLEKKARSALRKVSGGRDS